jgi:hypothetical protein
MGGNVTLGGTISAAAGPIGTGGSVQSALASPAAVFSYSRSKGLYAGLSLEGTVLIERKDANKAFYGSAVPAKSILTGLVPAPEIASPLYEVRNPSGSLACSEPSDPPCHALCCPWRTGDRGGRGHRRINCPRPSLGPDARRRPRTCQRGPLFVVRQQREAKRTCRPWLRWADGL